ncbi:MAG TPA: pyrimidine reductase family protein [Planosporangium sp.]|nr:pyrimidine reductase family protein [Planosporangium sp.]
MHRIFPDPDPTPLDDSALIDLYAPADRSGRSLRVNFVTSLDGAVTLEGYSEGLSSPPDKRVFDVLRMLSDALIVAAGTLRHEGYGPVTLDERARQWRRRHSLAEHLPLVVVSRTLALGPALAALTGAPTRPYVITCASAPPATRKALAQVAEVIVCGDTDVDLATARAELHERGLARLLCEGGPQLLGGLTAADLIDDFCLTVSPLLTGPGAGRITEGPPSPQPRRLVLRHILREDDMLLLRYAR